MRDLLVAPVWRGGDGQANACRPPASNLAEMFHVRGKCQPDCVKVRVRSGLVAARKSQKSWEKPVEETPDSSSSSSSRFLCKRLPTRYLPVMLTSKQQGQTLLCVLEDPKTKPNITTWGEGRSQRVRFIYCITIKMYAASWAARFSHASWNSRTSSRSKHVQFFSCSLVSLPTNTFMGCKREVKCFSHTPVSHNMVVKCAKI